MNRGFLLVSFSDRQSAGVAMSNKFPETAGYSLRQSKLHLRLPIPRAFAVQSRAMAKRKAKKSRTSVKRKSARSKKPAKIPKDAVALVVAMHAKPGQELLLQPNSLLWSVPQEMKKAVSCTTFTVPPMCPEIFYFMRFGPAEKLTRPTSKPRIFCAGTPAKTRY